jgi:hypothetical protein
MIFFGLIDRIDGLDFQGLPRDRGNGTIGRVVTAEHERIAHQAGAYEDALRPLPCRVCFGSVGDPWREGFRVRG